MRSILEVGSEFSAVFYLIFCTDCINSGNTGQYSVFESQNFNFIFTVCFLLQIFRFLCDGVTAFLQIRQQVVCFHMCLHKNIEHCCSIFGGAVSQLECSSVF